MINISAEQIELIWEYETFIPKLRNAFQSDYVVPQRNHYDYKNGVGKTDSTLLIMPARSNKEYVGIKIVTVSPYNGELDLSSIQGIYTLINAKDGQVQAQIGAKAHTIKKTAATSALASSYLSGEDSKTILMVGTGALCLKLIRKHCSVRPIEKGNEKALSLTHQNFEVVVIKDLKQRVEMADIISVATLSPDPLIFGEWLQLSQHLDLVGSHRPYIREADDECLLRSSILIDTESALKESGDLAIPISNGLITKDSVKSNLFEMTKSLQQQRRSKEEIILFKSVGYALEDLSGAIYLINNIKNE